MSATAGRCVQPGACTVTKVLTTKTPPKQKKTTEKQKNRDVCVQSERHKVRGQLSVSCVLLTSILLSSDPALLRRPRLPARDMQYHRLEIDSTPGSTTDV